MPALAPILVMRSPPLKEQIMKRIINSTEKQGAVLAVALVFLVMGSAASLLLAFAQIS